MPKPTIKSKKGTFLPSSSSIAFPLTKVALFSGLLCLSLSSFQTVATPILVLNEKQAIATDTLPSSAQQKRKTIGPTTQNDTLWAIAASITPKGVSIYKSIGAIYELNPTAFVKGNIHTIIPGSLLAIPTLNEIEQIEVKKVSQRLLTDEKPSIEKASLENKQGKQEELIESTAKGQANHRPFIKNEKTASNSFTATGENSNTKLSLIQRQIDATNRQVLNLIENNSFLSSQLEELQKELVIIKGEIAKDASFDKEIQKFIRAETLIAKEQNQFGYFNKLFTAPWFLLFITLLPIFMLIASIIYILRRPNTENDAGKAQNKPENSERSAWQDDELNDNEKLNFVLLGDKDAGLSAKYSQLSKESTQTQSSNFSAVDADEKEHFFDYLQTESENDALDLNDYPEYDENHALANEDFAEDTAKFETKTDREPQLKAKQKQHQDISSLSFPSVDKIDLDDFGEFEEEDAFSAALDEQREMDDFAKGAESKETKGSS